MKPRAIKQTILVNMDESLVQHSKKTELQRIWRDVIGLIPVSSAVNL